MKKIFPLLLTCCILLIGFSAYGMFTPPKTGREEEASRRMHVDQEGTASSSLPVLGKRGTDTREGLGLEEQRAERTSPELVSDSSGDSPLKKKSKPDPQTLLQRFTEVLVGRRESMDILPLRQHPSKSALQGRLDDLKITVNNRRIDDSVLPHAIPALVVEWNKRPLLLEGDVYDMQLLILSTPRFSCAFPPRSPEAYRLLGDWIDQEAISRLAAQTFSPEDLGERRTLFQGEGSAEAGSHKYQHGEALAEGVVPLEMSIPTSPATLLDLLQEIEEDTLGINPSSPLVWLRQFQKEIRQSPGPVSEGQVQPTFKELARNLRMRVQSLKTQEAMESFLEGGKRIDLTSLIPPDPAQWPAPEMFLYSRTEEVNLLDPFFGYLFIPQYHLDASSIPHFVDPLVERRHRLLVAYAARFHHPLALDALVDWVHDFASIGEQDAMAAIQEDPEYANDPHKTLLPFYRAGSEKEEGGPVTVEKVEYAAKQMEERLKAEFKAVISHPYGSPKLAFICRGDWKIKSFEANYRPVEGAEHPVSLFENMPYLLSRAHRSSNFLIRAAARLYAARGDDRIPGIPQGWEKLMDLFEAREPLIEWCEAIKSGQELPEQARSLRGEFEQEPWAGSPITWESLGQLSLVDLAVPVSEEVQAVLQTLSLNQQAAFYCCLRAMEQGHTEPASTLDRAIKDWKLPNRTRLSKEAQEILKRKLYEMSMAQGDPWGGERRSYLDEDPTFINPHDIESRVNYAYDHSDPVLYEESLKNFLNEKAFLASLIGLLS